MSTVSPKPNGEYPLEKKLKALLATAVPVFAALYAIAELLRDSALPMPAWLSGAVSFVLSIGSGGLAAYKTGHQFRLGEGAPVRGTE